MSELTARLAARLVDGARRGELAAEQLDANTIAFADAFTSRPDATPLALDSIKKRLLNILRHFDILGVELRDNLRKDVLDIMRYLARQKRLYPTGVPKELWISDDTVAALRASIWDAIAHDASAMGVRSNQYLLSVHMQSASGIDSAAVGRRQARCQDLCQEVRQSPRLLLLQDRHCRQSQRLEGV